MVNIETSSEIKRNIIEQEEPLAGIGEISTLLTPNKKRKRPSVEEESSMRRTRDSWTTKVVTIEIPIFPLKHKN